MKKFNVFHRLIFGFAVIIFLLAAAVSSTLVQVSSIKDGTDLIVNLRTPTAQASANMTSNIYASLATLRGWMLTGNPKFKTERALVWADISATRTAMDNLSKNWTNVENIQKWDEFKVILDEFSVAQRQVEEIAHTADERPATKLLVNEAAPRAAAMVQDITTMINLELSGNGHRQGDRLQLLGIMADTRNSLDQILASIRAYLLTADPKSIDTFTKVWAKNKKLLNDLTHAATFLSAQQKTAFDDYTTKHAEFSALPF